MTCVRKTLSNETQAVQRGVGETDFWTVKVHTVEDDEGDKGDDVNDDVDEDDATSHDSVDLA